MNQSWICPYCGRVDNKSDFCIDCSMPNPHLTQNKIEELNLSSDSSIKNNERKDVVGLAGWTCPKCGKTGNLGKYCGKCGTSSDGKTPVELPKEDLWTCSKCGKTNNSRSYCGRCGATKLAVLGGWTCPKCGKTGNQRNYCGKCGTSKDGKPPVEQPKEEQPKGELWTCPKCGYSNNSRNYCGKCGTPKLKTLAGWTCPKCGKTGNQGKYCGKCGTSSDGKTPVELPKEDLWTCSKCGKTNNSRSYCGRCGATKLAVLGGWTCPKCGKTGNQRNYCGKCGTSKDGKPPVELPKGELWTCSKCGYSKNSRSYCGKCGATKLASLRGWTCPTCGRKGNTKKYCGKCGTTWDGIIREENSDAALWTCSKCGKTDNTRYYCGKCGAPRNDQIPTQSLPDTVIELLTDDARIEYNVDEYKSILITINQFYTEYISTIISSLDRADEVIASFPDAYSSNISKLKSNIIEHMSMIRNLADIIEYSLNEYEKCDEELSNGIIDIENSFEI